MIFFERITWTRNDFYVRRGGRRIAQIKQQPEGSYMWASQIGPGMGHSATLESVCKIFNPHITAGMLPTEL